MKKYWIGGFVLFTCCSAEIVKNYYQGLQDPQLDHSKSIHIEEQYFEQRVDHFRVSDQRIWQQRYWENGTNYKAGGPVFLLLSGEAPATTYWMTAGAWHVYARDVNAMMFMLEHRYYGGSQPTNDTSTENLEYLTSDQALADTSYFIAAMNKNHNFSDDTKWIAFGGSYAGNLAVWLRMKYPHFIHAAVSSSAPLTAKLDFPEFFRSIKKRIASHSRKCEKQISRAFKELEVMIRSDHGRKSITKWLKLCDNLTENANDVALLHQNLANNIANLVQNDKSYKGATGLNTVKGLCDFMTNVTVWKNKTTSVRRFIQLNTLLFNLTDGENCLPADYKSYFEILKQTDWDISSIYGKPWMYQTCSEFGFFQTSSKRGDTFGRFLPIQYFTHTCQEVFGSQFNASVQERGVNRTNLIYGGLNNKIDRILYIQGSADPWYSLGIYTIDDTGNKGYDVVFIKGTTHCADMFEPSDKDSVDLKDAREQIRIRINSFITEN